MVRSFKEFAAAMMRARKSLVRRRRDSEAGGEDSRAAMGSRAYLDNLGPIAVETLCLWCSRVGGTGAVKNVEVLDDIGSAAADALNALFLEEPKFSLRLLLPAGVVPALIHACSTSHSPAMQTAGAGALLNLAREEEARKEIVMAGGISSLISLLRQKPCPPAVARSACGALQNISLTAGYEDPLIDSGALDVLLSLLSNSSDELVQERAAACIANLTAGGERARLAVLERKGVPVLVQQLEVVKRKNARTGVSELAPPSLSMICAVGGALKGLAQLPKVDGMLYGTGAIMQTAVLLEYLKMSMEWRPAVIGEEESRALEALMEFIRNVSVHATQGKHREELRKSNLGVVVGKFVKQLCPAETERFPEHARRLLVEAISAVRNLSIGNEEMQNQLGSSGVIETLTGLVEKMLEAPWRSEVLLVETLHALANCMQNSSLNRQRALAARCMKLFMTLASQEAREPIVGGACSVLCSLSMLPDARTKMLERDGLPMILAETITGCAGTLLNFGSVRHNLVKFVQLGGCKLVTKHIQDCGNDATRFILISLIQNLCEIEELRLRLVEEGLARVSLKLIALRSSTPEAVVEVAASVIATLSHDRSTKMHLVKMGAAAVLEEACLTSNETIKRLARSSLNSLT
ncbi:hypothetical protein GUITHDRAFT_110195 [Guillardia theta CCMP2712]|uniref:Uncharacterized protein n=3 Tax=Guillardia theta TaxID=55529 RepID=L1J6N2_GUITC|nr:hypothetical protein GUITHDRAFT_110195 [Guillardia theta CCMP2712]EKX43740.1 hypothetical protein GUITHDRAFT_110195 [Guillardia theta CCMP2712]|eukprot:XP_005830720.1 hypothetical protein GUITHDRAFT_110195 [Guillardia theta CCMP2712]